jgi:predicted dehydrogenase
MKRNELNRRPNAEQKRKLGFVGLGWIGLERFKRVAEGFPDCIHAFFEPDEKSAAEALAIAPNALRLNTFEDLIDEPIAGVVIATPNSFHSQQAVRSLDRGIAVFCQKPLCLTAEEAGRVVRAAREADRLLSVDHSYRWLSSVQALNEILRSGSLGTVFGADLVFHNAYGPQKKWFFDHAVAGGGCLLDLGVHLLDLLFWVLGPLNLVQISASLFNNGKHIRFGEIEDYAAVNLQFANTLDVSLRCSWNANIGQDAQIEVLFHGTEASAAVRNTNGSFFDFRAEKYTGTSTEVIAATDSGWNWGARAIEDWIERLDQGWRYDPDNEQFIQTAEIIDKIYYTISGGVWQKQNAQQNTRRSKIGSKSEAATQHA